MCDLPHHIRVIDFPGATTTHIYVTLEDGREVCFFVNRESRLVCVDYGTTDNTGREILRTTIPERQRARR